MVILDIYGITFHAVVVLGLGFEFLFKSVWSYCGESCTREKQGAILAPPKHQAQGQRLDLLRQRVAV